MHHGGRRIAIGMLNCADWIWRVEGLAGTGRRGSMRWNMKNMENMENMMQIAGRNIATSRVQRRTG